MDQHRLEIDGLNDYMDQRGNGPTDQRAKLRGLENQRADRGRKQRANGLEG